MASLYKNNGTWYIAVRCNNQRKCRSLKTKDHKVAKLLKPEVEKAIILELMGIKPKCPNLPFPELAKRFLNENKYWLKTTYDLNDSILRLDIAGKPLPTNPTFRLVYVRHINQC